MAEIKLTYLPDILDSDKLLVPDYDTMCLTRDFTNTKRFSPVIYNPQEALPDRDSPEYDAWWIEQYQRCIMGYIVPKATRRGHSIWIPGRLYFYLNFWIIYAKLDGVDRKGNRNPKFTSLDYFKAMCIEMMFMNAKDLMFPKSRQKGFSEFSASNLGYNFIFIAGSQSVVVAGMGQYAEHTMENVIRGLNNLGESEFYKRRSPDRADYIKASYKEEWINEETGEKRMLWKGYGSEVYAITAMDNTQAVSRLTPFMVLYEEIGKWKKGTLIETSRYVAPSLKAEGVKTGYQIFIGTSGSLDESVADVEKMAYHPGNYNLLEFENIWEENSISVTGKVAAFVPSYEFQIIDEDGNSMIEESKAYIMDEWAQLTSTARHIDVSQRPFYLSQMFMMTSGGFFGETALMKINDKKRQILIEKEQQITFQARLEWYDSKDWGKGVECIPDEEGQFFITQRPDCDANGKVWINLYNAATDSYDKDESNTSFSQGSCTIFKGTLDINHTRRHFVARVTERPSEEDGGSYKFFEDSIKLCVYYGDALNTIEYSNILIFDYYKRKGYEFLLKERPSMVIAQHVQDGKANQKYGIEQSFVPHALNMLRDEMKRDDYRLIEETYDLAILEAWGKFKRQKGYNCDITISTAYNIVSLVEDEDIEVYSEGDEEEDDFGGYRENNNQIKYGTAV